MYGGKVEETAVRRCGSNGEQILRHRFVYAALQYFIRPRAIQCDAIWLGLNQFYIPAKQFG